MRPLTRVLPLGALLLLGLNPGSSPDRAAILGRWRGTSTCVVAPWNASCNNERIVYRFTTIAAEPEKVMLHAFKVVDGIEELMGDLPCTFDPASNSWQAPFANARVSIVWSYRAHADSLAGTLIILPDRRVARHVVAVRDSA